MSTARSETEQLIEGRRAILEAIKEELVERLELELEPQDIDDDTFLFGGGLSLDSIDSMEIIIGMQSRFGVMILRMTRARFERSILLPISSSKKVAPCKPAYSPQHTAQPNRIFGDDTRVRTQESFCCPMCLSQQIHLDRRRDHAGRDDRPAIGIYVHS